MPIQKTFTSKNTRNNARPATGELQIMMWPDVPQIEMWTADSSGRTKIGPSFVLTGVEAVREYVDYLNETFKDILAK